MACACERACVRACVRACARVRVCAWRWWRPLRNPACGLRPTAAPKNKLIAQYSFYRECNNGKKEASAAPKNKQLNENDYNETASQNNFVTKGDGARATTETQKKKGMARTHRRRPETLGCRTAGPRRTGPWRSSAGRIAGSMGFAARNTSALRWQTRAPRHCSRTPWRAAETRPCRQCA